MQSLWPHAGMDTNDQTNLPGVKPGRFYSMKKLPVFLFLLLQSYKNRLHNRKTIYIITVVFLSLFFIQQTIFTNMILKHVDIVFNKGQENYFIYILISTLFSVWILPQFIVPFRLSLNLNISRYYHLPIDVKVFALSVALFSISGIGALLVTGGAFLLLDQLSLFEIRHIVLLILSLSSFFIINTWIREIIDGQILRRVQNLKGVIVTFGLTVLFIIIHLYASIPGSVGHEIFIYLPSGLTANALINLYKNNLSETLKSLLFLFIYLIIIFYIYCRVIPLISQRTSLKRKKSLLKRMSYRHFFNRLICITENFTLKRSDTSKLLIAKEFYYFTKSKKLQAWYIFQIFFVALLIIFSHEMKQYFMMILVNGICFLALFNIGLYMNIFAYESKTVQNYFIYPVDLGAVFSSKNGANLLINILIFMALIIGLCVFNPQEITLIRILCFIFIFIYANFLAQSLSNIISVYYSMKVGFNHLIGLFNPFPVLIMMILVILIIAGPVIVASGLIQKDGAYLYVALICFIISVVIYTVLRRVATYLLYKNRTLLIRDLNSWVG